MIRRILVGVLSLLTLASCSIVNPYNGSFSCPDTFHGKCTSVQGAYKEALAGKDATYEKGIDSCIGGKCPDAEDKGSSGSGYADGDEYSSYKASLYKRYDQLLKEPRTPVVAPPKVMRVLIFPYKGQEDEFYMYRYVYFFAEKPKWVLGDSVIDQEE